MTGMVPFTANEWLAIGVTASFASGLNVYATLASLGLLARAGVVPLPSSLHLLASEWVIGAALLMFVIEFFADKVPAFDLIWNALQTFIRVPVAALLAWAAAAQLSPQAQLASALLGALIAFASHGGKLAVRAGVTSSPEPVSNIALSLGEDAVAIFLTWLATQHPYIAAAIVFAALVAIIIALRAVWRALKRAYNSFLESWSRYSAPAPAERHGTGS